MNIEDIKEKFKNHVLDEQLNVENGAKIFVFKDPKNSNYWQQWIIVGGRLIVVGDCYDSVYQWSGNLTLKFLADCDIHYFSSKCTSDANGNGQYVFNSEEAARVMKEFAADNIYTDHLQYDIDYDVWCDMSLESRFKEVTPIISRELVHVAESEVEGLFYKENLFEAWNFINDDEYYCLFGHDFEGNLRVKTATPYHHLAALKVAYEKYPDAF